MGKFIVLGETDMRAASLDEQDFAASGRTAGGKKAPATGQMTIQRPVKWSHRKASSAPTNAKTSVSATTLAVGAQRSAATRRTTSASLSRTRVLWPLIS